MKVLDNNNEIVEMHFDRSKVLFKYKNLLFQSRLLEGNYPETSKLVPTEFPIVIKFNNTSSGEKEKFDDIKSVLEDINIRIIKMRDLYGNRIVKFTFVLHE